MCKLVNGLSQLFGVVIPIELVLFKFIFENSLDPIRIQTLILALDHVDLCPDYCLGDNECLNNATGPVCGLCRKGVIIYINIVTF